MAENEIARVLELVRGGLKFDHDEAGWWWSMNDVESKAFASELDAVRDFCRWYAQIRTVKDAPQPAAFNVDKFMMDGIQALALAAAEEMRARGDEFDAESIAGQLAMSWHDFEAQSQAGRWPYDDTPIGDDYDG